MIQQALTTLGSIGSIGVNTLDIISHYPEKFRILALAGHRQVEKLAVQYAQFVLEYAVVVNAKHAVRLEALLKAQNSGTRVLHGAQALIDVASADEADGVMCAIVDVVGLPSALAAAQKGKTVYLTNKETLVVSDVLFTETARTNNARVLPIDSEHSVIFRTLPHNHIGRLNGHGIRSIILTISGGPLPDADLAGSEHITSTQAVKHPSWGIGKKILVDSATMMSKGLELIEAHWLFNYPPDNLEVVTHPQSVVRSMVRYLDGSVLAQLGNPGMRTPIVYCLGLPERIKSGVDTLDFDTLPALTFRRPDLGRFPCLKLAHDTMYTGGSAPCVSNAASEMAVAAFLGEKIRSIDIARVVAHCLDTGLSDGLNDIENPLALDTQMRVRAQEYVENLN